MQTMGEDDKSTKGTHPHAMWACSPKANASTCPKLTQLRSVIDAKVHGDDESRPAPSPWCSAARGLACGRSCRTSQACELHNSSAIHSAEAKREAGNYPCTRCGLRLSAAKQRHGKINLQSVPDADFNFVDSRHGSMLDSLWGRPVLFHMQSHK